MRDGGYDVTDFYAVHPRLGSLGDFADLLRACDDRGIRVIIDLVVNHTSDCHPWFTHNLADRPVTVDLGPLPGTGPDFGEVFGDRPYTEPGPDLTGLGLAGYGFRWIRLNRAGNLAPDR
jgi:glycosidase